MNPLKLTDTPQMPKGYEKYQGMKLEDFALWHPMLLVPAMNKAGWELDAVAKAALFNNQHSIKTSKNFIK